MNTEERQIENAMNEVATPAGLRDSLLRSVRAAAHGEISSLSIANEANPIASEPNQLHPARLHPSQWRANRRWLLGVGIAAACSGLAVGIWRQQPLSQDWLAATCLSVLQRVELNPSDWQTPDEDFANVLLQKLRDDDFLSQVRGINKVIARYSPALDRELRPLVSAAEVYELDDKLFLLELTLTRPVRGMSGVLAAIPTARSDSFSLFGMSVKDRTFVLAGRENLARYVRVGSVT